MSLGALFACSRQELVVVDNETLPVQFTVNVMDLNTKATGTAGENVDEQYLNQACPAQDELIAAVRSSELMAHFKITDKNGQNQVEDKREIRYSTDGDFITDPYDLPKKGQPWELSYFTVCDKEENILYSAVGSSESKFATFLREDEILPHEIRINKNTIYNKTTQDVAVICAMNTDAEAFGFKMWGIDFINLQTVSFMVNDCGDDGRPEATSGKLEIYEDDDTSNSIYDEGSVLKTVYFHTGVSSKLYLLDRLNIDNDKEFYGYKLYKLTRDKNPKGVIGVEDIYEDNPFGSGSGDVTMLSEFKNSDAWVDNLLDLNLCNPVGDEDWIFGDGGGGDLGNFELYVCNTENTVEATSVIVKHVCIDQGYRDNTKRTYYIVSSNNETTPLDSRIFINFNDICSNDCHYTDGEQSFVITYTYTEEERTKTVSKEIQFKTIEDMNDAGEEFRTFEDYLNSDQRITNTCTP